MEWNKIFIPVVANSVSVITASYITRFIIGVSYKERFVVHS